MTHDLGSVALTLVAEGGYREVDDLASVLHRHRVLQHEEGVGALFGNHGKSGIREYR